MGVGGAARPPRVGNDGAVERSLPGAPRMPLPKPASRWYGLLTDDNYHLPERVRPHLCAADLADRRR